MACDSTSHEQGPLLALLAGLLERPVELTLIDRPDPVRGVLVAANPGGVVLQQDRNVLAVRPQLVGSARAYAPVPPTDTQKAAGEALTAVAFAVSARPALLVQVQAPPIQGAQPKPAKEPPAAAPRAPIESGECLPNLHAFPPLWQPESPAIPRFRRPL